MAIEFTINLNGNFSGALKKGNDELHDTGEHAKKAHHELELFEGELGKISAGALKLNFNAFQEGGHFLQFDLAEGALIAYEAIEKLVDGVIDLGKEIIKAAADAEDLNVAIELDVGEEGAKKVDELAESFSNSRFSPKQIKEALLPILEESGTAHQDQWNDLTTAATDVATRRKTGIAGAKSALQALNEIELNPQRLRGSLKELGIKQTEFYGDLGNLLGISSKAAEKQVKAGQVKSQTLLSVALNQIAQREGGALGNATNKGSNTLGASIDRLANLKDNIFEKLAGSQGMGALQSAIDNFVYTLQGPVGTDLMNTLDQSFVQLFGDLSGPQGAKKIQAVILEVTDDVKAMFKGFQEAWPAIKEGASDVFAVIKEIARELKMVVDGYRDIVDLTNEFTSGRILSDAWDSMKDDMKRDFLGDEYADETHPGVSHGNRNFKGFSAPAMAGGGLVSDTGVKPANLDIFGLPKMAGGGLVSSPTLALIGEAGPEAVVPLGRSFGSMPDGSLAGGFGAPTITYAPQFHFSGVGGDVRGQIENFEMQHRVELQKFVDQVRAAVGA
jgi:hypothetical protein